MSRLIKINIVYFSLFFTRHNWWNIVTRDNLIIDYYTVFLTSKSLKLDFSQCIYFLSCLQVKLEFDNHYWTWKMFVDFQETQHISGPHFHLLTSFVPSPPPFKGSRGGSRWKNNLKSKVFHYLDIIMAVNYNFNH